MSNVSMTIYHGTASAFATFDPAHYGKYFSAHMGGFWFADHPRDALPFALNAHRKKKPINSGTLFATARSSVTLEARRQGIRKALLEEFKWSLYNRVPVVPGGHWKGAAVLVCEVDGDIYQAGRGITAPGVSGNLFARDTGLTFEESVAAAKAEGCVGVHFPAMLEGVGAELTPTDTTFVFNPEAINIISRSDATDHVDASESDSEYLDFQFWEYADFMIDEVSHLPMENGHAFDVDEDGSRWTSCGDEASDIAVVTYQSEPTCEFCKILYQCGDDNDLLQTQLDEYFREKAA